MKQAASPAPSDARVVLQQALSERCASNPKYSLRAFARSLGLSHTFLSLVLSGQRPLSAKAAAKIAEALGLDPATREALISERPSKRPKKKGDGNAARRIRHAEVLNYRQLSIDAFEVISEWYHYPLLCLLESPLREHTLPALAKALEIQTLQVKLALERLIRLGLVERDEKGGYRSTGRPLKVENTVSTAATRKFHRQLLNKAVESLERDPFEVRDFSSMTFSMDPSDVPYAREKIREFRRKLMADLESRGAPREVYSLSVQIFPLSVSKAGNTRLKGALS